MQTLLDSPAPVTTWRRQLSDIPRWNSGSQALTTCYLAAEASRVFARQRSTTIEGMSLMSGRGKPIEMSSELKADRLQVNAVQAQLLLHYNTYGNRSRGLGD